VFGSLLWELPRVHRQSSADYAAAWHRLLDDADPAAFPNLVALRDTLPTSASEEQFEYGLERLVESLRAVAEPQLRKRVDAAPAGRRRKPPDMRP
jgi:hypothetical protein